MSRDPIGEQTLALAGVAQFVGDAQQIAAHGRDRSQQVEAALRAVFCTDAERAGDVIGSGELIQDGVHFLRRQFSRSKPASTDAETARTMGQVLRLAARLLKSPEARTGIRGAIDRARLADPRQAPAVLDTAYREHISPLGPQIRVRGHPTYLNNPIFEQQIRTCLLAAVRCAVLWQHCGGRFWRLVLKRRQIAQALQRLDTTPTQR